MGTITYEPIREKDKWPICPHCEKEMEKVKYFEQEGIIKLKVVRIFVCPHCLKALGTAMVGM